MAPPTAIIAIAHSVIVEAQFMLVLILVGLYRCDPLAYRPRSLQSFQLRVHIPEILQPLAVPG